MITPSELFSSEFKDSDSNPINILKSNVMQILDKINEALEDGSVCMRVDIDTHYPIEIKNQNIYHQLICKLVNEEMNKFGWIVYIRVSEMYQFEVKLAVKESDLDSISINIIYHEE